MNKQLGDTPCHLAAIFREVNRFLDLIDAIVGRLFFKSNNILTLQ